MIFINSVFAKATSLIAQTQTVDIPRIEPDASFLTATVLPLIFGLLGGLSLLFVVIGALRFVISSGEPSNTKAARETIIYALVGLIVSISAFTIVGFVVDRIDPSEGQGALIGPQGVITNITELLIWAVGVVSVIMVIIGGLRFVVSAGDPGSAKSARDTILYALIGLVIAMAAQGIVVLALELF